MTGLHRGLYEQLVTEGLEEALSALDSTHRPDRVDLHPAEAADRISFHLAALVRRSVAALDARQRAEVGARLAREIVSLLAAQGTAVDASDGGEARLGIPDGSSFSVCLIAAGVGVSPSRPPVAHPARTKAPIAQTAASDLFMLDLSASNPSA